MDQEEWLRRYAKRMVDGANLTPELAAECAQADDFAVLSEFFEDDPEGAADEELSCWEWDT